MSLVRTAPSNINVVSEVLFLPHPQLSNSEYHIAKVIWHGEPSSFEVKPGTQLLLTLNERGATEHQYVGTVDLTHLSGAHSSMTVKQTWSTRIGLTPPYSKVMACRIEILAQNRELSHQLKAISILDSRCSPEGVDGRSFVNIRRALLGRGISESESSSQGHMKRP